MLPQLNEEIELVIERLGIHGEGVGRVRDFTVFVDGALPGEQVRAQVYERKATYARARLLAVVTRSLERVEPVCPLFGRCGGCQLLHLAYPAQLEAKRQRVCDAFQRIGKLEVSVAPCRPSPEPLGYRNKIQLPVSARNRLGLYARNTHDLIEIDSCAIHCPLGERALQAIQPLLGSFSLKHVLIKTAVHTQQLLILLVTKKRGGVQSLAEQIFHTMPEIKGVVQNVNPQENNVILGKEYHTLVGQGWIEEELCGLRFKVSPASFFQVNPAQAEALYNQVLTCAAFTGQEVVLDAYCGVGTLSLLCARGAQSVIGIESVPEAIVDAKHNAQLNGIHNARFLCGKAEEKVRSLPPIDTAILNPPRKGCEQVFLEALLRKRPRQILYVSCDPATLARDVSLLTQGGYGVTLVQPFDMFPQTMHVETVVSLQVL